nr:molybdopterin-guanine dinucleotide biosynthesis protein B [uncultured Blautia sp.]
MKGTKKLVKRKRIVAISGIKNSGKTTLICRLLEIFKEKGLRVAVLKHDGHDFEPDVPGTDTYRQLQAGAYGTAVFSKGKYMLVKQQPQISEKELMEFFPEADLILLEGFKYSTYPKIEIVRKGNSAESVSNPERLMAIATNLDAEEREALSVQENVTFFDLDNAKSIAEFILSDYFR